MSELLLVPTGHIIREYMEEYKISQKELALRTGMSEKHISHVLNGSSRLTEEFALKLEKVLSNPHASYWLNYEAKYREQVAREEEQARIRGWDLEEISKRFCFQEVFRGLQLSLEQQALEMLRLLKISDFSKFDVVYSDLPVAFMEDGGTKEAIAIWLNICESEIELQNNELTLEYSKKKLTESISQFKLLSNNNQTERSIQSCRKLCNRLGIYLVFCDAITNCKVRGALSTYKGHPAIYLSGRFKTHAHIWFAFMHELAHLLLHYDTRETLISFDDESVELKEVEANEYARNIFVNAEDYGKFVENKQYTEDSIRKFAKKQGTIPEFVVGQLQHDREIGFDQFRYI